MHPGLYLNYLKYFHDAASNRSISSAAKKNFVTQSAISQGIQKLEKTLKNNLTTHQRHLFKLTREGELVFSKTKQIFNILEEMQQELDENDVKVSGPVHFICPPSIAMSFIIPCMRKLKEDYPEVHLHLRIGNTELIHKLLREGSVDFGIVLDAPEFKRYSKLTLRNGCFQIYSKNPKASLQKGILVDCREGLNVAKLKVQYLKRYKKELHIIDELDSWEVVARFIEEGMYCGFLPDFLFENKRYSSIYSCKKVSPPIRYEIVAVSPKGMKLSRAATAFLNIVA